MIQVGVADDHLILRNGLKELIGHEPDMKVVAEASNGRQTLDMLRSTPIDVLVLDLAMPGVDGLDTLARVKASGRDTRVLVLTGQDMGQFAVKVLRQGAAGVLSKGDEPRRVIEAIRAVAKQGRYLSPEVADLLAANLSAPPAAGGPPHENLTERELQLLIHFGRRKGSTQVARDLNLSPKTVSTYRTVLLQKLGLKTNSDMVHYALKHKLID